MFLSSFQSLFYWMFYFNFCLMARIVENWVVSILILLDVLLQLEFSFFSLLPEVFVSILILLDVLLQLSSDNSPLSSCSCFNPYFTGCSTSTRQENKKEIKNFECFNPYFTGCSTSTQQLIIFFAYWRYVSILILLDVLLQLVSLPTLCLPSLGFNPYFTGCSTSTDNPGNLSRATG